MFRLAKIQLSCWLQKKRKKGVFSLELPLPHIKVKVGVDPVESCSKLTLSARSAQPDLWKYGED